MVGAYRIIVKSKRLQYDFEIRRQITIISGDSAKGKTQLVDMIRAYNNYGTDSGVEVQCNKECIVIEGKNWKSQLDHVTNSIIFIDEGNRFVQQTEFAEQIKYSDNYYVIITREKLSNLPYSINEIYGIRESKRYGVTTQTYNEIYNLYGKANGPMVENPKCVITEDTNSGFQFFEEVGKQFGYTCKSAKGKSNVKKFITPNYKEKTLIIVDGAAFGPEMNEVMAKLKRYDNFYLYTPESFEWLLLKSKIIRSPQNISLDKILAEPENYVDTIRWFSWERYFTYLLTQMTIGMGELKYSKSELASGYKKKTVITKILNSMEKIDFNHEK